MHASPVGNHSTIEFPFTLQDIVQQILIGAHMLILIEVIRSHNGPRLALEHGGLEGRQIDFVERTVVDNHICCVAIHFLIVEGIMLHASSHAIALHPFHIGDHHLSCEIRVFTHILEISSIERCAVDVHAGTK